MGVPSFYRWLANKYPKIVVNAVEEADGDATLPNPNGREIHNLYLDMNGIIHPCFHPDPPSDHDTTTNSLHHGDVPLTYEQVLNNIYEYIDRIFNIVRPRKLLYLAIDGVAPRAKMNQQRTRRFRTAKDRETLGKEEERLRRQYEMEGKGLLPKEESEVSDSNVITPGTEFMYTLSKKLQKYIRLRVANHPAWKGLKVILSDANVPGEGEHKIMSFIRLQRGLTGYDPNTRHCLYGLDADLIMLALATHEVHFSILRENVLMENGKAMGHSAVSFYTAEGKTSMMKSRFKELNLSRGSKDSIEEKSSPDIYAVHKRRSLMKKPYQFLHVWVLREYLSLDMKITNRPDKFEEDLERVIDDFIFICFFAGNDFLPHMPTLEIHEGAIDLLIHVYKEEFKNLGGYLVDTQRVEDNKGGYIKLKRVEKFILSVGKYEDKIFKKRSELRERKLRHMLSDLEDAKNNGEEDSEFGSISARKGKDARFIDGDLAAASGHDIIQNTKMLKEELKLFTRDTSDVFRIGLLTDKVKLSSPGWKKRYYEQKFSADNEEDVEKTRKEVVEKYTEGLCWVLLYYFSGVPTWTWFYPFHYGPFASDMKGLSHTKIKFQKGLPFKPFDQLMAVLPPTSGHALPRSYQSLMTSEHSNILDFYPSEFEVDTDGKRYLWQGICKLPFIEEDRLLAETKKIEKELSEEEATRNRVNDDQLFIHSTDSLALQIISICKGEDSKTNEFIKIDISTSEDISGFMIPKIEDEIVGDSDGTVRDSNVLCVLYRPPCFRAHVPRLLESVIIPEMVVNDCDVEETPLWHDNWGNRPSSRSFQNQGVKKNPCIGSTSSFPGTIIKDAGRGWRGRGKMHDVRRTPQEQMRGPAGTGSRHACNMNENFRALNLNPYGRGRGTNSSFSNSHQWRPRFSVSQPANAAGRMKGSSLTNGQGWRPRFPQSTDTHCDSW